MTKVYGRICIIVHQEEFEILDDDKGVIIRLQEPVIVTEVVIINILETLLCFPPQTLSALLNLFSSMSNHLILILNTDFVKSIEDQSGLMAFLVTSNQMDAWVAPSHLSLSDTPE